ncbi:hypothetical protein MCAV_02700 [[Mycoplasma] cavipharyngis]|uniref:hypothetical protein n=1 Tax=[Mycoplasma] cavipharyngis TaxID=92757 RepID=UPI003704A8A1
MYAYDVKNYSVSGFERDIFKYEWERYRRNANYSVMRVRFFLELQKIDGFSYKYRVGMNASAYQWFKTSTSATKGKAGFRINNINYVINNESSISK